MNKPEPVQYEVSANQFIEAQTRQIEKEFKCSRPRPRNKSMGFKGKDFKKVSGVDRSLSC